MRLKEKQLLLGRLAFIKGYVECIDFENTKEAEHNKKMALLHIEDLYNTLDNFIKDAKEQKAVDNLTQQAKYQAEICKSNLSTGDIMNAAYHDMLSKALYHARSVIVNDSYDEFEYNENNN